MAETLNFYRNYFSFNKISGLVISKISSNEAYSKKKKKKKKEKDEKKIKLPLS